jgi:hypothetical protein
MVESCDQALLDKLISKAPNDLAGLFFRYKPLFLAMKKVSKNKTIFNKLRKDADHLKISNKADYLLSITTQVSNNDFSIVEFRQKIKDYSLWRKIRLLYALYNRLSPIENVVYKIRNGKLWVKEYDAKKHYKTFEKILKELKVVIAEEVSKNLDKNVKYYIPENVNYSLPQSEKMFVGNIPYGSYISSKNNTIIGIQWYNQDGIVDLDLSIVDKSGKYGWDANFRSNGLSNLPIVFSGDVTNASGKYGASEFFYYGKGYQSIASVNLNYYSGSKEEIEFQFVASDEKLDHATNRYNYILNPNKITFSQRMTIKSGENQKLLALLVTLEDETRIYFSEGVSGNDISLRNLDLNQKIRNYYNTMLLNIVPLSEILELAGAKVVRNVSSKDKNYVDLSIEALGKDTILKLLNG